MTRTTVFAVLVSIALASCGPNAEELATTAVADAAVMAKTMVAGTAEFEDLLATALEQTQEAQPTNTETATATATARPGMPVASERYLTSLAQATTDLDRSLLHVKEAANALETMDIPTFLDEIKEGRFNLELIHRSVKGLSPPAEVREIHDLYVDAIGECHLGAVTFEDAILTMDVAKLKTAAEIIVSCMDTLEIGESKINAYSARYGQ